MSIQSQPLKVETIRVENLNANDVFLIPGVNTIYVCDSRRTTPEGTRVEYHVQAEQARYPFTFTTVNLATMYLLTD